MKHFLLICCLLIACVVNAQKEKESFYLFDKDWNTTKNLERATYIMHVIDQKDTLFVCRIYNKTGPMVRQESYKDKDLKMPHGRFIWYDSAGRIDSTGMVYFKKKDGEWDYYNDTLGIEMLVKYDKGKVIERKDFHRRKLITAEVEFDIEKPDTTKGDAREAMFKGGPKGYKRWLENNLKVPERTTALGKDGLLKYQFIVNKEGWVENVLLLKSLEWAADAEIFRVMSIVPRWEPAFQQGKNVIYQAKQSLTFYSN